MLLPIDTMVDIIERVHVQMDPSAILERDVNIYPTLVPMIREQWWNENNRADRDGTPSPVFFQVGACHLANPIHTEQLAEDTQHVIDQGAVRAAARINTIMSGRDVKGQTGVSHDV